MNKVAFAFLSFSLVLSSQAATANCDLQISEIAAKHGHPSDRPSSPVLVGTLQAGDARRGAQGQIGPSTQDVYLYLNSGSYHSGWFQEAFALDLDCNLRDHGVLYAE
ncbi:hypothetical protein [Bdellovibrio bacteriovorus]|uniref:Uncharacterized protein n=1 Tax=Bdellovibrio bacteriovorus TaxID=959 RepID=A0A1Z3N9V3_BDEBC|nr:hypothetical protein [Bdellovibrio bacteriovorus]ASD64239.1 hypothetical protein B9G79_12005 [Bdellovibrio bacteriovorus]